MERGYIPMWIRILTAVVALAVFIPCLLFAPNWVLMLLFGLLAAIAVYEVANCTGLKKEYWLTISSMLLVFLLVAQNAFVFEGKFYFLHVIMDSLAELSGLLLILLYVIAGVVRHEKLPVEKLCLQGFFCVYIQYAFFIMSSWSYGRPQLWIALCIPWVADTAAYFIGRFFGKRKLCPNISPKKTVEGAIGGVVSTGIVAVLVYAFAVDWTNWFKLLAVCVCAMLLAVVSIFGDLFASVVKRRFDVKDYGKLFPGHGGVLDRFDSTLAVAVAMKILSIVVPTFFGLILQLIVPVHP